MGCCCYFTQTSRNTGSDFTGVGWIFVRHLNRILQIIYRNVVQEQTIDSKKDDRYIVSSILVVDAKDTLRHSAAKYCPM